MQVVEGPRVQDDALVRCRAGHPVELAPGDVKQRDLPVAGQLADLVDPLVALDADRDVDGDRGNAGPHRLRDGVATSDDLVRWRSAAAAAAVGGLTRTVGTWGGGPLGRRSCAPVGRVTRPLLRL